MQMTWNLLSAAVAEISHLFRKRTWQACSACDKEKVALAGGGFFIEGESATPSDVF
jgi:hypothetical protein